MIVGTCLSLAEIRGIAAKFKLRVPAEGPADFQLHTTVVRLASQDRKIGKALTKLLDRKHSVTVARFGKVDDTPALTALWNEALARGEVAAACWAAMSHPAASDDLRTRIFAEVHMLSHQVGATARADLRRLHELSTEKSRSEAQAAEQLKRLRGEIDRKNAEIRALQELLRHRSAEARPNAQPIVPAPSAADELDRLRIVNADLERRRQQEENRRKAAEADARTARDETARTLERSAALSAANQDLREENRLLEAKMAVTDQIGACSAECRDLDLCGRCILFVGGRHQHIPHFRRLVEESGGVFAHHDGGVEESIGRLPGLCGRADAILFPVDCISHRAQDEVKQLCRRWDKPLFPLRRTGLGAFIRALETVATQTASDAGTAASSARTPRA